MNKEHPDDLFKVMELKLKSLPRGWRYRKDHLNLKGSPSGEQESLIGTFQLFIVCWVLTISHKSTDRTSEGSL